MTTNEREAFELEAESIGLDTTLIGNSKTGVIEYAELATSSAYIIWQHQQKRIAELESKLLIASDALSYIRAKGDIEDAVLEANEALEKLGDW